MKLAESLMHLGTLNSQITDIQKKIQDSSTYAEDEEKPDLTELFIQLDSLLAEKTLLSIRITNTNDKTMVVFEDRSLTLSAAMKLRQLLQQSSAVYRSLGQEDRRLSSFLNPKRVSKDHVKYLPTFDTKQIEKKANELAERARNLNVIIQRNNWEIDV